MHRRVLRYESYETSLMIIENDTANSFIQRYMTFLLFAYHECAEIKENEELLQKLSLGRDVFVNNRDLLDDFITESKEKSPELDNAIRSLIVDHWIYLRDTTKYSLFISDGKTESYAVLGLTQPIKDIFGCSGLYMKTGLVQIGSHYVCDGLISNQVILGKNYRCEFNSIYKTLKLNGKFFKQPISNSCTGSPLGVQ